jgi:sugar lactone lactonase YvrE
MKSCVFLKMIIGGLPEAVLAAVPDGICLDAEGAIWGASPISPEVFRLLERGRVSQRIKTSTKAFACMLGGQDCRTLFILTAESSRPEEAKVKMSRRIEMIDVDIPGAGLP